MGAVHDPLIRDDLFDDEIVHAVTNVMHAVRRDPVALEIEKRVLVVSTPEQNPAINPER
jgi:hypothetical protein